MLRACPNYLHHEIRSSTSLVLTVRYYTQQWQRHFLRRSTSPLSASCGCPTAARLFSSASNTPTRSRARPALPRPQRYVSNEELHKRIEQLREEEVQQEREDAARRAREVTEKRARRAAFQLAIAEALTHSNPTIRAFQLATAQTLMTEDEISDALELNQDSTGSEPTSESLEPSRVAADAFMEAVDTAVSQGLAESEEPAGTLQRPPRIVNSPGLASRSHSRRSKIPARSPRLLDQVQTPEPPEERSSAEAEGFAESFAFRIPRPPKYTPAVTPQCEEQYRTTDVYTQFSPEWLALLDRYQALRRSGIELGHHAVDLETLYRVRISNEKALQWHQRFTTIDQGFIVLERAAHQLRHSLRAGLTNRLIYRDAVTLETWHANTRELIHNATSELTALKVESRAMRSLLQKSFSKINQLLVTMEQIKMLYHTDEDGFHWLSYLHRLLRNVEPITLLEKSHFVETHTIARYRVLGAWELRQATHTYRLASERVHRFVRVQYGHEKHLPLKERLFHLLRRRVYEKCRRVDETVKEMWPLLEAVIIASFMRNRLEYESGSLKFRESAINASLSNYVDEMRRKQALKVEMRRKQELRMEMRRKPDLKVEEEHESLEPLIKKTWMHPMLTPLDQRVVAKTDTNHVSIQLEKSHATVGESERLGQDQEFHPEEELGSTEPAKQNLVEKSWLQPERSSHTETESQQWSSGQDDASSKLHEALRKAKETEEISKKAAEKSEKTVERLKKALERAQKAKIQREKSEKAEEKYKTGDDIFKEAAWISKKVRIISRRVMAMTPQEKAKRAIERASTQAKKVAKRELHAKEKHEPAKPPERAVVNETRPQPTFTPLEQRVLTGPTLDVRVAREKLHPP